VILLSKLGACFLLCEDVPGPDYFVFIGCEEDSPTVGERQTSTPRVVFYLVRQQADRRKCTQVPHFHISVFLPCGKGADVFRHEFDGRVAHVVLVVQIEHPEAGLAHADVPDFKAIF